MNNIREFGITITWSIDDVQSVRPDLTDDQAEEVLEAVLRGHDASIGINWTVIETHAAMMFPRPSRLVPVIYELEPIGEGGAPEACGVHWYCSEACRDEGSPVDGKNPIAWQGAFRYGMAEPGMDGRICESCLKIVADDDEEDEDEDEEEER